MKNAPYMIAGKDDNRVLLVLNNAMMRFRFTVEKDGAEERIIFQRAGGKCIAPVHGIVHVYKKPAINEFHWQYMKENGIALYRGLGSIDDTILVDNMLEYIETI